MRMFEGLWISIGERVTDLIFRMEQINEDFVSNTLRETSARHEEVSQPMPQQSDMEKEQEDAINNSSGGGKQKVEPIRNRDVKIGRNDPCSCGSGKKYKSCCMRKR